MASSILIVDDDPNMRELLRLHLSSAGYDVRTACDGIEAGYSVLQNPPDLIITDINMPHMDGLAFIDALKSDKGVPPMPVIFLSSSERNERSHQPGVVDYIVKPVRADKLLATVARHLPGGPIPIG